MGETFDQLHAPRNILCVDCALKTFQFYQNSDSSGYFLTYPNCNFPSNKQIKFLNHFNYLGIIKDIEENVFKLSSKYFTTIEFQNLDLYDNSRSLFIFIYVNSVSLNK